MKSRYWFMLSLLLLVGAALCWREGERRLHERPRDGATNTTTQLTLWDRLTRKAPAPVVTAPFAPKPPELLSLGADPHYPFRLRNTHKPEAALFRSETAVLLRNAHVETLEPVKLDIPDHLRAQGDPGSWLVQARGNIDDRFRAVLRGAGVEIVSYVPNNAYLVRASAALAQQLRVSPRVQSVLPFEPYYKLDMQLLPLAVRQEAMPAGRWLNVVVFPGQLEAAKAQFRALGADIKSQQPFPFGHVITIAPPGNSLVALAQMPVVQNIEGYNAPMLMTDLSRVRLDVSTNTTDLAPAGNWGGLTGAGVMVGLVGSGAELSHPQFAGAIFSNPWSATTDVNGHETLVGSVIAGRQNTSPTPTNGSIAGADYRGMAPGALLFPLSLYDRDYTNYGNIWVITNAAQLSSNNLSIVNNSWGYPVSTYDINSAIYDMAVRDSLAYRTNDQPITYVFAAGNSGNANSGGTGGAADTIASPGNAKNVITVGASELFRFVPNSTNSTPSPTNDPLAIAHTDSFSQVSALSSRGNVGVGVEGPSGRFKPDFVAPGEYVVGARASTFTNLTETDTLNMLGSSQFRYERGTSVSAGQVSGVLALIQEFFASNFAHSNTPSFNKALLINRARSLGPAYDFSVNSPVTHQGWGIPSLSNTVPSVAAFSFLGGATNSLAANKNIVVVDESAYFTNYLATGEYHCYDVQVPAAASVTNQLRITLAWTDPPGNPISSTKLVNDLDLCVTNLTVGGAFVRAFEGNNIAAGTTVSQETPPGSQSQRDNVNNVENTFIPLTNTAAATVFQVYVFARKVNVNAVSANGTNGVVTNTVQDYTLILSTDTPARTITVRPSAAPAYAGYTNRLVNIITNGIPYINERVGASSPLMTLNTNGTTNQWNFYIFTNQNYSTTTATNLTTNIVAGVTNISTNVVNLPLTNGGPYVAFSTFLPPNLARARNKDADVDLFMTRSLFPPASGPEWDLTNLNPAVLSDPNTLRSTNRGGYELITMSNSVLGEVFYVGVKSEDQQGGSYGFFGAASQSPFGTNTTNGGVVLTLFPAPMEIPDGSPEAPGGVVLYGICTTNIIMQSISNLIAYTHENLGDLVGTLTHNGTVITLNNHTITPAAGAPAPGGVQTYNLTYDDFRNPPDGPGDVTDLIGQDGIGLWIFEIYDNAPLMTGTVDSASIYMRPFTNQYSTNANVFYRTVTLQAGQSFVDFLNIPVYCTNLDVDIVGGLGGVPGPVPAGQGVDLLAGVPGLVPTSANYSLGTFDLDSSDTLLPHMRISSASSANLTNGLSAAGTPALTPGRWNFRIINNTAGQLTLTIRYTLGLDLTASATELTYTNALVSLLDNYTTNLYVTVPQDRVIAGVDVGISIKHPRVSDLVVHLVSPSGTRVLLLENRGWTNGLTTTNFYGNFSENTNYTTHVDTNGYAPLGFTDLGYLLPVKFVPGPYSAVISPPSLFTNATNLTFGYENSFGSVRESPGGLAQIGKTLIMVGKADRNGTNDAFIVSYQTPIETNRYTSNLVTTTSTTNLIYLPVTNWASTNYWTGPISGYRGTGASGSGVNEQTFFNGVAANLDGIFAAGQTRNYFPPTQLVWTGDSNRNVYDVDLGCTSGSVNLAHMIGSNPRAQIIVEYQGLPIMDFTPAPLALATNFVTNLAFNGASHFLRVTVNPATVGTGMAWTNALTIYRSNSVTYSVTNFVVGNVTVPATLIPNTLSAPRGVAMDVTGNVYVADSGNNRILRFGQSLTIPNTVSTNGSYVPLTLTPATIGGNFGNLNNPGGVAIMPNGNIVVADTLNNLIRVFTNTTGAEIATYGDTTQNTPFNAGSLDSAMAGGPSFNAPAGIAVGTNSFIYVADTGNDAIRQISSNGVVTTIPVPAGLLSGPRGIAVYQSTDFTSGSVNGSQAARMGTSFSSATNLYVADTLNHRIVWLQASNATWSAVHLAGDTNAVTPGRVDSTNSTALFNFPVGITRDGYGNLFVSDAGSHIIRQITPMGDVRTVAGDYTAGTSGSANQDSGLSAKFNTPLGLVADNFGAVFVADFGNDAVRVIAPYQTGMPTNGFATYYPFAGPTNFLMGGSPVFTTRGLTNSVFGLEYSGASSRDAFNGVATSAEGGTNFLYAVGSAQFSTNATPATLVAADRMFITKFATNGQPIWTVAHMPTAVINPQTNGAGAITNLILGFGGSGYSATPVVVILDPLNPIPANRSTPVTVTVAGGVVTGIASPATPLTGPFVSPRVYVEPPTSLTMPGNGVAVAYNTNVIAVGYTNISDIPLTTNNQPFIMSLEATNGMVRFASASPNSGHYNAAAVSGDTIITVGAQYAGGVSGVANSNCLIEAWSLSGATQVLSAATMLPLSTTFSFGAGRPSQLSGVVAVESLDRAYAVGCVSNNATSVDAILMEIDLSTFAVVSVITNNITNGMNFAKGITTDGVDLYVAVDGPGDGNASDRQAAVFRYRAKNFYLAEETLDAFVGERTWGSYLYYGTNLFGAATNYMVTNTAWRLEIADTRAGGTNGTAQVVSWSLNFTYAPTNTTALTLTPGISNPIVLLSAAPQYFRVAVPSAATAVTNLISASGPVRVTFHPSSIPLDGDPKTVQMFTSAATGSFVVSTNTNALARLRPGSAYYIGVQALNPKGPVNLSVRVDYNRTEIPVPTIPLTNGLPLATSIARTAAMNYYTFNVPSSATATMFEILSADGDVNLYLSRSNSPGSQPTLTSYDYRSANFGTGIEQIYLVTNTASSRALSAGTWFLGVQNAGSLPANFTLRATTVTGPPYTVVDVTDAQLQTGVSSPGNAPNVMFKLGIPTLQKALIFELRDLTGPGDLIVRKSFFPLSTTNNGAVFLPGTLPEIVTVRTNAAMPNLIANWYFGVLNPGSSHISYTVMARQPTNGVLLSSVPIQIPRPPNAAQITATRSFGFDLDVVPGEKYQVQYLTSLSSTNWLVLTNIVAPPDGAITFLHSGALSNRNLYYRIKAVP